MTEMKQTVNSIRVQRHKLRLQVIGAIKSHHADLKCVIVLTECAVLFGRIVTDVPCTVPRVAPLGHLAHHNSSHSWVKGISLTHPLKKFNRV